MLTIACVSQKGGVGKSTLTRDIAVQFTKSGWEVKIADLDTAQKTSVEWAAIRMESGTLPEIAAEPVTSATSAIEKAQGAGYHLLVFDGKPHSDRETKIVCTHANLIVIPTSATLDDLRPQIKLAHELVRDGIERGRIVFVLNNIASELDGLAVKEARSYIEDAGYRVTAQALPRQQAYQNAQNRGLAISETPFATLRSVAERNAEEIYEILVNGAKT